MISLQFVQGNDIGAALIEWFGHGAKFSHVDSILPDGRLLGARADYVGGAPPGVQMRDPSYVGDEKVLRVDLHCSEEITAAYYQFIMLQIGKPYDDTGILAFVVGRDWQEPDAWFCSELVAAGLQESRYFIYPLASTSNKITPPDLILLLSGFEPITLEP